MTQTQHTPGPWEAEIYPDGKYFPSVVIGYRPGLRYFDGSGDDKSMRRQREIVINVGPPGSDLASNSMEVCNSNARLIAAAPELLEAAECAVAECGLNGSLEALDAAIAKAKEEVKP